MNVNETIALPDGGWAELRPHEQVSERQRRPILALMVRMHETGAFATAEDDDEDAAGDTAAAVDTAAAADEASTMSGGKLALIEELNDLLIVARVVRWSYGDGVDRDAVLDLPGPVYDALRDAAGADSHRLVPNFDPTPDRETPTGA